MTEVRKPSDSFLARTHFNPISMPAGSKPTENVLSAIVKLTEDGVAIVSSQLPRPTIEALRAEILSLAEPKVPDSPDLNLRAAYHRAPSVKPIVESSELLSLASHYCGPNAQLRTAKGTVRSQGCPELALHTDKAIWYEPPFADSDRLLVVNVVCDSYDPADGGTFFVPGSHGFRRNPTTEEAEDKHLRVSPVPQVSDLLCWTGETWHGRWPRTNPGERVVLTLMFSSPGLPLEKNASTFSGDEYQANTHSVAKPR